VAVALKEEKNKVGREDEIRLIARSIWEEEGCPDGLDHEHWLRAEAIWEERARKATAESAISSRPDSVSGGSLQPNMETEPCARCRAKGVIVCPVCQGTREIRNTSYVLIGQCQNCRERRGFVTCPNCLGMKVVDADRLREMRRLEAEAARSNPAVWGFTVPTPPRRISVDAPRTIS
jgi:hypothetical protein